MKPPYACASCGEQATHAVESWDKCPTNRGVEVRYYDEWLCDSCDPPEDASMEVIGNLEEHPWKEPPDTLDGRIEAAGCLPHGTLDGKPAVALRARLRDGRVAVVQTSLEEFIQAAAVLWLKYGRLTAD